MGKRSVDVMEGAVAMTQERRPPKKTERSHEENQERAYVAASRRSDRSLEARVQSARAASDIHKKRTGKGFKITEEIVLKEEMYEEEEDDTPRAFRLLAAAHLHTASPELNGKVNAFITQRVAMATWNYQREVHRMFAENFPQASQHCDHLHQSSYFQSLQPPQFAPPSSPPPPPPPPPPPAQDGMAARMRMRSRFRDRSGHRPMDGSRDRSRSPRSEPHMSAMTLTGYPFVPAPSSRSSSRPSSRPSSGHPSLSHRRSTSARPIDSPPRATSPPTTGTSAAPIDSGVTFHSDMPPSTSSFTSQLPPNTRTLASVDMTDSLAQVLMGGQQNMPGDFRWPAQLSSMGPGLQYQPSAESPGSPYFSGQVQLLAMSAERQSPQPSPMAVSFSEASSAQFYHSPQLDQEQHMQAQAMFPPPGLYIPTEVKTEPGVETVEKIDPLDDTWQNMINFPDYPGNQGCVEHPTPVSP